MCKAEDTFKIFDNRYLWTILTYLRVNLKKKKFFNSLHDSIIIRWSLRFDNQVVRDKNNKKNKKKNILKC